MISGGIEVIYFAQIRLISYANCEGDSYLFQDGGRYHIETSP